MLDISLLTVSQKQPGVDDKNIFAESPFCSADGICHETPDQPSPRTIYSARNRRQYQTWWDFHAQLNQTAADYVTTRQATISTTANRRPLILFGDSITESWVGTSAGSPAKRSQGVPDVLQKLVKTLESSSSILVDPVVLAISGDQTQHLLYRMMNGQLLPHYADDSSSLFVAMIGTNNLGAGELPGPTAKGVLAVVDYLLSHTKGTVLLFQLLPRGDASRLEALCPPRCNLNGEPFTSFVPAIDMVNQQVTKGLDEGAGALTKKYGSHRIHWIDCSSKFSTTAIPSTAGNNKTRDKKHSDDVKIELMPDLLHPNVAGHRILADCISTTIQTLQAP